MREIARNLGIGREVVRKILQGDSLVCDRRDVIANGQKHSGPKERCLICGAMVSRFVLGGNLPLFSLKNLATSSSVTLGVGRSSSILGGFLRSTSIPLFLARAKIKASSSTRPDSF